MLSRTAENLFWTARYFERAETTARLLDVGYRMSMMPSSEGGFMNEWEPILAAAGVSQLFSENYDEATEENIKYFMIFDERNPSSIRSCVNAARENARAARTALTSDSWQAINKTYLRLQEMYALDKKNVRLQSLCDWMKRRSSTLCGTFNNTQLQDQGFDFFNLGFYIERADNTARLLDVKYYILLPTIDMVGGGVDMFQWFSLLRAMSARRSFHWIYNGDYSAQTIAHFLILNQACPRSLSHCVDKIDYHLTRLGRVHGKKTDAHEYVGQLLAELGGYDIQDIINEGLHEFLTEFIVKNSRITEHLAASYLFERL